MKAYLLSLSPFLLSFFIYICLSLPSFMSFLFFLVSCFTNLWFFFILFSWAGDKASHFLTFFLSGYIFFKLFLVLWFFARCYLPVHTPLLRKLDSQSISMRPWPKFNSADFCWFAREKKKGEREKERHRVYIYE